MAKELAVAASLTNWTFSRARSELRSLLDAATEIGPQRIAPQGGRAVVVIDADDFSKLIARLAEETPAADYFSMIGSALYGGGDASLELPSRHVPRDPPTLVADPES